MPDAEIKIPNRRQRFSSKYPKTLESKDLASVVKSLVPNTIRRIHRFGFFVTANCFLNDPQHQFFALNWLAICTCFDIG